MTEIRRNEHRRACFAIGLPPRSTTTTVTMAFVALLLLLPPLRGSAGAFFADGFGPLDPGVIGSAAPAHAAALVVADTLSAVAESATATAAATDLPAMTLAGSGIFDSINDIPITTDPNALGFDNPPAAAAALAPSAVWALRLGSGLATYFGFVFATDRPRGQLGVPLAGDNDLNDNGDCLRVGPSTVPGAGLGLFAARFMPKGTVLGTYPGVLLPLGQHSASAKVRDCPACASYIWRFTDNQYVIDPTDHGDGTLGPVCKGGNPSQPGSVVLFNVLSLLGLWRGVPTALCRINEPPKGGDVNVVTEEDLESRTVTFALERDVYAGEELHIDYGLTYDRSGYGGNPGRPV